MNLEPQYVEAYGVEYKKDYRFDSWKFLCKCMQFISS